MTSFCVQFPGACPVALSSSEITYNSLNRTEPLFCSPLHVEQLAVEILRIGWVIGDAIAGKIRNSTGLHFTNGGWEKDPYFGSLYRDYKRIDTQLTHNSSACFNSTLYQKVQSTWSHFKGKLVNETLPASLRKDLGLDHPSLGLFSDTPLVISETPSPQPNVVTPKQFKEIQLLYDQLLGANAKLLIEGSEAFKKEVQYSLRIFLSTETGRKLLSYLISNIDDHFTVSEDKRSHAPGKNVYLTQEQPHFFFGKPNSDKAIVLGRFYTTLFHELTHLVHKIQNPYQRLTLIFDLLKFSSGLGTRLIRNDHYDNEEEFRTIQKTNEFRKQLYTSGNDSHWFGRYGHSGISAPPTQKAEKLFFNLQYLLAYRISPDESKSANESLAEILMNPNFIQDLSSVFPSELPSEVREYYLQQVFLQGIFEALVGENEDFAIQFYESSHFHNEKLDFKTLSQLLNTARSHNLTAFESLINREMQNRNISSFQNKLPFLVESASCIATMLSPHLSFRHSELLPFLSPFVGLYANIAYGDQSHLINGNEQFKVLSQVGRHVLLNRFGKLVGWTLKRLKLHRLSGLYFKTLKVTSTPNLN